MGETMGKLIILAALFALGVAWSDDDLHTKERSEWNTADLDSASNNIPTSPDTSAGSKLTTKLAGTGAAATIGHTDHAIFCSTATTRIRVRFSNTAATAPTDTAAYNLTMPAAAASSYVCVTLDDVQLGQYIYIWSAGAAISSGLFWAFGW